MNTAASGTSGANGGLTLGASATTYNPERIIVSDTTSAVPNAFT